MRMLIIIHLRLQYTVLPIVYKKVFVALSSCTLNFFTFYIKYYKVPREPRMMPNINLCKIQLLTVFAK